MGGATQWSPPFYLPPGAKAPDGLFRPREMLQLLSGLSSYSSDPLPKHSSQQLAL